MKKSKSVIEEYAKLDEINGVVPSEPFDFKVDLRGIDKYYKDNNIDSTKLSEEELEKIFNMFSEKKIKKN